MNQSLNVVPLIFEANQWEQPIIKQFTTISNEVEFLNGNTEILTVHIIVEDILSQVDEEGHRQIMLDEIIDH